MPDARSHRLQSPELAAPAGGDIPISVLGVPFRLLSVDSFLAWVDECVAQHRGAYVSAVNASSVVQSMTDQEFAQALRESDVNLPDGTPVAWAISRLARHRQPRLPGPAVMLHMLGRAQARGHRVLFYGSTDHVLQLLQRQMKALFPGLAIAGAISPPFRPLSRSEDDRLCEQMRGARPDIVLIGLGAPKQEIWMHAHRDSLEAVLVGVGAAFDFHAGVVRRAPAWMSALASNGSSVWSRNRGGSGSAMRQRCQYSSGTSADSSRRSA